MHIDVYLIVNSSICTSIHSTYFNQILDETILYIILSRTLTYDIQCVRAKISYSIIFSGYALFFPNKGVTDYVNILGMRNLSQFTICFWMKSNDRAEGTAFSYSVPSQDNELIVYNYGNLDLNINGDSR